VGALLGFKVLPHHWTSGLTHREWLLTKAETTSQLLGVMSLGYTSTDNDDTAPDGGRGLLEKDQLESRWQHFVADLVQEDQRRKKEAEAQRKKEANKGIFSRWK